MLLGAYFRKAAYLVRLSRRREITLGSYTYRTTGFFVNSLALQESSETCEPWLDVVYQTALKCKQGAFLDVGANIGQTMLKVLALDKTRQYVGFEPQVLCCSLIQSFIEENGLKYHTILPLGLSNRNQLAKLHIRGGQCDVTASMVENVRPGSFYTSDRYICVRRGDELVTELKISFVSVIKIDVEGAELEVMEGLLTTIREKKPSLVFEVLNHYLVITGEKLDHRVIRFRESRIERIEALLRGEGYQIYNVLPGNVLKRVRKIQPAMSRDLSITSYVAVSHLDVGSFLQAFPGTVQDS